jgi:hypothetical protein
MLVTPVLLRVFRYSTILINAWGRSSAGRAPALQVDNAKRCAFMCFRRWPTSAVPRIISSSGAPWNACRRAADPGTGGVKPIPRRPGGGALADRSHRSTQWGRSISSFGSGPGLGPVRPWPSPSPGRAEARRLAALLAEVGLSGDGHVHLLQTRLGTSSESPRPDLPGGAHRPIRASPQISQSDEWIVHCGGCSDDVPESSNGGLAE